MFVPRSLASAVDKVARQSAGKDWGLYANLLDHWTEIVGADYARVTTPVKITFPYQPQEAQRKNGTLLIRLPKGLAMEFTFKADLIRQRINSYFGHEVFARITLESAAKTVPFAKAETYLTPSQCDAIKNAASVIEDSELRDALESFGASMMKRNLIAK